MKMNSVTANAAQLQKLLYVVWPTRERMIRGGASGSAVARIYVWGKRTLRRAKS